jgi:hypothetical protein
MGVDGLIAFCNAGALQKIRLGPRLTRLKPLLREVAAGTWANLAAAGRGT